MLHLFFAVGFSAVPLTLFVPPVRNFNLFVASMEELWRESSLHTVRMYPRLRQVSDQIYTLEKDIDMIETYEDTETDAKTQTQVLDFINEMGWLLHRSPGGLTPLHIASGKDESVTDALTDDPQMG
ncbi:hypothetical protein L2E82_30387 [Cichorium intybus]|uniref:Uncharacterized protein n=1 Tax=Cichorium intybus TaxID=13427 RepID=A0ACB9D042_CICIN|nr:hypothetical protein L2E82_30387 [Cichorium intybus]